MMTAWVLTLAGVVLLSVPGWSWVGALWVGFGLTLGIIEARRD